MLLSVRLQLLHFNPRSREGSDQSRRIYLCRQRISIHAPAKGATTVMVKLAARHPDFNPRSREGSDYSVPPYKIPHIDFNPRSREGSDSIY